MRENFILKNEERAVFELRSLYKQYGYLPYKMSKFEEYDLYVRNKDFLVSDSVITFNEIFLLPPSAEKLMSSPTDNDIPFLVSIPLCASLVSAAGFTLTQNGLTK